MQDQPAKGQTSPGTAFLKLLQRLAKWVIGATAVASLMLTALPTALSTTKGLQAATAIGSRILPGTLHIDSADLGWRKPVKVSGITLQAPAHLGGETLASVASLRTNARLWDIARFKPFDVIVSSPQIDCTLSASGKLKWAQLVDYESGKTAASSQSQGKGPDGAPSTQNAPLVTETTDLGVTGEARLATASIYVSDGTLRVPQEVKEVIGQDLHLVAVVGSHNLEESREEFGLRHDEAGSYSPHNQEASTSTTARAAGDVEPAVIAVRSEHLDFEVAGWTQRNGRLRLRKAATAQLQFTPALATHGLARISPLLSGILAVEKGIVQLTVTTPDMHIPSESYHVRIDPLRVAVNKQDLLAKSIEFLRLKQSKEVEHKALLQGATSALHVDLNEVGGIKSKRLDLLISSGRNRKGVHLCTWGEIDPVTNNMDVALGIPSNTLAMIGLEGLPESEMLVIPVRGSTAAPRVDWVQAYKRLAALGANYEKEPTSLSGQILQGIVQGLDLRANAPGLSEPQKAPPPVERLPWESDHVLLKRDVQVDSSTVKGL